MIIPNAPGYTLLSDGQTSWAPIPRIYSPPKMHPHLLHTIFWLPEGNETRMGLFIGTGGVHFKNITLQSGATYLFLLKHGSHHFVDIWGPPGSEHTAIQLLNSHWLQNVSPFLSNNQQ